MTLSFRSALVALMLAAAAAPASAADPVARRVVVTGQGSIDAAPDYAEITIGATTAGPVAKDVMADNAKAVSDIIAAAKGEGVEAKDIKTSNLSIYPVTSSNGATVTGYRASNTVRLTLRDLARIGEVIDKTLGKGANTISGVAFLNTDPDGLLDKARPLAFEDARRKAEIYAKASGAKLGRLIDLNETNFAVPRLYAPMAAAAMSSARPVTPVEPGETKLTVNVSATFELTD